MELFKDISVVLGSGSPRRQDLLKGLGVEFTVMVSDIEEIVKPELTPAQVVVDLAQQKNAAVRTMIDDDQFLITSDTVVVLDGEILGKPKDTAEAKAMIDQIQGRSHEVLTGVVFSYKGQKHGFYEETTVHFNPLTAEEIAWYVEKYQPLDKAGAYGVQEWIGYVGIRRLEGCYYNVMGLPLNRLYREAKTFLGR